MSSLKVLNRYTNELHRKLTTGRHRAVVDGGATHPRIDEHGEFLRKIKDLKKTLLSIVGNPNKQQCADLERHLEEIENDVYGHDEYRNTVNEIIKHINILLSEK